MRDLGQEYAKVLMLDEIGYLPLSHEAVSRFFRLVVQRDERARLIVPATSAF